MGFLKKIFGGIFAFLGRLLGLNKKEEYYVEIADSGNQGATTSNPSQAAASSGSSDRQASTSTQTQASPSSAATATQQKSSQKKSAKQETSPQPAAQTSTVAQTQTMTQPKPAQQQQQKESADTLFAPNFLNPFNKSTPRRRPSSNMTSFLQMAQEMNVKRR
jgi:hypothetical protein